jgi:short-subunit dehydrogenase
MTQERQTALITGASAGIGRLLAGHFARDGYDLVLVARRAAALEQLAAQLSAAHAVGARVLAMDLSDPGGAARVHESLAGDGTIVDVVVNNAGFGLQGHFARLPLDRQLEMIQLNIVALTELTRRFLPGMLQRNRGGVLNVASTAAFQPGPFMSVYYATKAYVLSFTEALAEEVSGSAVRVSCLAPGPTDTEFAEVAGLKKSPLFTGAVMEAEPVARAGYEGWTRGKVLVVPGASNRLGAIAVRLAPRAKVRKITRRLNEIRE